jgi:hypothetical protein
MECGCRRLLNGIIATAFALAIAAPAVGQQSSNAPAPQAAAVESEIAVPAEQHAWGRFPVGSWKSVRVTSEVLDDAGRITNVTITDTKTTLVAADAASYTLRVEVTVEVAGKRFSKLPETIKHGYQGEKPGQQVAIKRVGEAQVAIDGRAIDCEVRQATIETDGLTRVSNIHYCSAVWPHQFKRETTTLGPDDVQQTTTVTEVVALDLPEKVGGEMRWATHVKTTHKQPSGTKTTLEIQTAGIPGSVVSHSATEHDAAGKMVRRSTLELRAFGVSESRPGEFAGRRRQARKAARRMEGR